MSAETVRDASSAGATSFSQRDALRWRKLVLDGPYGYATRKRRFLQGNVKTSRPAPHSRRILGESDEFTTNCQRLNETIPYHQIRARRAVELYQICEPSTPSDGLPEYAMLRPHLAIRLLG